MIAIGNDELGEEVRDGDLIVNIDTLKEFPVKFNHSADGSMCILTIKDDGEPCMVGIHGKLVSPWVKKQTLYGRTE